MNRDEFYAFLEQNEKPKEIVPNKWNTQTSKIKTLSEIYNILESIPET